MMRLNLIFILCIALTSCQKQADAPPEITLSEFAKESRTMYGTLEKLLSEKDVKIVHDMTRSLEESRVVTCKPVGRECDQYYKILNLIVKSTSKGEFSLYDRQNVFKLYNELKDELSSSEAKLSQSWKSYILTHP